MADPAVARSSATIVGLALGLATLFVLGTLGWQAPATWDTWGPLFIGPVLFLVSLPILARQAAREQDRRLFVVLIAALLLKLIGAVIRHYVAFEVYGGIADASGYSGSGAILAQGFRAGQFDTGLESLTGTDFIGLFTGIVYAVAGPTMLGGFLIYSWLGFWGLFLFYRAFVLAVPEGRSRSYARLLFFLPSLVFWPSSIGKEAWMLFALGIAAFGVARVLSGTTWRGLTITALGLWMAALVRPHMAGIVAVALACAYVLRPSRTELRELAVVAKGLALVAVAIIAFYQVGQAERYLEEKGVDTEGGLVSAVEETAERTGEGGSEFAPSILRSPATAPIAAVTVLFRPFIPEAHNAQALAAAFESTFLLLLSLVRIRWFIAAVRAVRRQSYVLFALVYTGLFVFAYSGIANFGILARQRAQLLPLFLVLLSLPPAGWAGRRGAEVAGPRVTEASMTATGC